jgi:regulator of protease activity HflC (stomatin/prohibitin superfamily)
MPSKRILSTLLIGIGLILFFLALNPFAWNDAGYRTVVTQSDGHQFVQYNAGMYYQGLFAKSQEWPNQISVSYREEKPTTDMIDNTIEIGKVEIRFNDATTADVRGITQYILPVNEKEMIDMHNAHKTPEALVNRRLGPYTQECLQSSSQLMSSEMHYGGGRAQMAQDYLDQLKNGVYILKTVETSVYDSLEKVEKRAYETQIIKKPDGSASRKFSSIKEYGITVADAQITKVDYQEQVQTMLKKKIQAATDASVSKQRLMTAQQQQLTAEAEGKKRLVEIEYQQKQEQTKQVVAAQTEVELAKQDLIKQDIALQGSVKEAAKIKNLADAEAYARSKIMQADGGLEKKLATYEKVQGFWAKAFSAYTGNLTPLYVSGNGGSSNAGLDFMQLMSAKAAQDLVLQLKSK